MFKISTLKKLSFFFAPVSFLCGYWFWSNLNTLEVTPKEMSIAYISLMMALSLPWVFITIMNIETENIFPDLIRNFARFMLTVIAILFASNWIFVVWSNEIIVKVPFGMLAVLFIMFAIIIAMVILVYWSALFLNNMIDSLNKIKKKLG